MNIVQARYINDVSVGTQRDGEWLVKLAGPGSVASPLRQITAVAGEYLNTPNIRVHNLDIVAAVNGDASGFFKLAVVRSFAAPFCQISAVAGEF